MNNKRIKGVYKLLLVVIIVFIPNKGYCDEYDITLSRNDFDLKGPVVKVTIKDCQFKEEFGELIRSGSKDKNIFFYGNGNVYKIVNSPNTYKRYNYDDHGYLIYEMQVNTGGGIPQIIDDKTFDLVQEKMGTNKKAPARARAKTDYLLTTKLFCGHCKNMMVATRGWLDVSEINAIDFAKKLKEIGVKTIIFTDIAKDMLKCYSRKMRNNDVVI